MRRRSARTLGILMMAGGMAVLAGCNAAPAGDADPLAAVCPGSAAELTAIRTLFGGFVDQDLPKEDAQDLAETNCTANADAGAEFDACMVCFNAAIDEAYE